MALRHLTDQIQKTNDAITNALLYASTESVGVAHAEFKKLRAMLDSLTSFTEHRWQVKLFTRHENIMVNINAENLVHAVEIAEEACDDNDDVIRFELYCDGIQIPQEDLY